MELFRQTGSVAGQLNSQINVAIELLWFQGMLGPAEQQIPVLRELQAALPDPGKGAFWPPLLEGGLLRFRGHLRDAATCLQALCKDLAAVGMLEWLEEATFVLADVLLEMRQGQEGEATALEAIRASGQYGGTSIAPRSLLSAWHAGHGTLEQARLLLSQAHESAAASPVVPWEAVWLSRADAHLATAEGRKAEGLAGFEGLASECGRLGLRWYTARFTCEWAEALLARGEPGDRERACSLLNQAAAEFEATGASFYAGQARRRMNELDTDAAESPRPS
jgi:hypothetical protein